MVTTVGTSNDLPKLIENFILLERDAIAAYDEVVARLEKPTYKSTIAEFRGDHLRHLSELEGLARDHGATIPKEGDAKEMLTTGKVQMADMAGGDGAILRAMSTNESDTVSAYERGSENDVVPVAAKPVFTRALEDERRHKTWMEDTAKAE